MTSESKSELLKNRLAETLSPLLNRKVALFGLPLHGNIGDSLIALGEFQMIKELKLSCIYKRQLLDGITDLPHLPHNTTILFQGGGDFGDTWPLIHDNRLRIMNYYRDYRIVVLPQSIKYNDESILRRDVSLFKQLPDLHICCRDKESFTLMKQSIVNNVYLLPDMAFYINRRWLKKAIRKPVKNNLYLKRIDKESAISDFDVPSGDVSDWPTIKNDFVIYKLNMALNGVTGAFKRRGMGLIASYVQELSNYFNFRMGYKGIAKAGVEFISEYKNLYVTRLHAAILAVLIGRQVTILDNSYHKNRNFYEAWLSDIESVHFAG